MTSPVEVLLEGGPLDGQRRTLRLAVGQLHWMDSDAKTEHIYELFGVDGETVVYRYLGTAE